MGIWVMETHDLQTPCLGTTDLQTLRLQTHGMGLPPQSGDPRCGDPWLRMTLPELLYHILTKDSQILASKYCHPKPLTWTADANAIRAQKHHN